MSDLVLIHGAFHSEQCWSQLAPRLETLGYRVVTPRMAIDRPDSLLDRLADQLHRELLDAGVSRPVLVGHSMGAAVAARVALRMPCACLVFLAGGLPAASEQEQAENLELIDPGIATGMHFRDDGLVEIEREWARHIFYHDVETSVADAALDTLRPQWGDAMVMNYQPISRFPLLPLAAILCQEDRILPLQANLDVLRRRYSIEPVVIPGGHSPFLGRPQQLAQLVHRLVQANSETAV